jgi:peptidoglycan L-alanyl-D-glutamate endopeptidase CwlK
LGGVFKLNLEIMNTSSIERLKGVNPILIDILISAHKTSPHRFEIPRDGGVRTTERQQELYSYGRTDLSKKKVTNTDGVNKLSKHQIDKETGYGQAFDIFILLPNGKASWDKKLLTVTAQHILKVAKDEFNINLTWGGSWKNFPDLPHFQL